MQTNEYYGNGIFAPPNRDRFYNLDEVPSGVASPEAELLQHNTEVIRRQVSRRQEQAVARIDVAAVSNATTPLKSLDVAIPSTSTLDAQTHSSPAARRGHVIAEPVADDASDAPATDGAASASVTTAAVSPQIKASDVSHIDHPDVYTPCTRGPRTVPAEVMKQPRNNLERVARINMYLHRKRSNAEVNPEPREISGILEPPGQCCQSRACSFCTGPLLQQRYCLLQRLYQLNTSLYGTGRADDLLENM